MSLGTFCPWEVLSLGPYVITVGRFVHWDVLSVHRIIGIIYEKNKYKRKEFNAQIRRYEYKNMKKKTYAKILTEQFLLLPHDNILLKRYFVFQVNCRNPWFRQQVLLLYEYSDP